MSFGRVLAAAAVAASATALGASYSHVEAAYPPDSCTTKNPEIGLFVREIIDDSIITQDESNEEGLELEEEMIYEDNERSEENEEDDEGFLGLNERINSVILEADVEVIFGHEAQCENEVDECTYIFTEPATAPQGLSVSVRYVTANGQPFRLQQVSNSNSCTTGQNQKQWYFGATDTIVLCPTMCETVRNAATGAAIGIILEP